ncbi:penicillin acylase family protein, partial [Actinophytocola sp.]|uniref:penicillin acylase family protein n=1 Tax=Actinophytocola sp. TaxID=1872138 RepID=UPI00389A9CB9
ANILKVLTGLFLEPSIEMETTPNSDINLVEQAALSLTEPSRARLARALLAAHRGCPGDVPVPGLDAEVAAVSGPGGVTRVEAGSWLDAVRALGYLTARDRGFQLELARRTAAGRLSEVWGRPALPVDERYRRLGLEAAAEAAAAALAPPERDLLAAYAAGVTAAWHHHGPPFECRFLSYRPKPWTPTDSLLVALYLLHALSWEEPAKRADAVIRRAFPPGIAEFLLPGGPATVPAGLAAHRTTATPPEGVVALDRAAPGSNAWIAPCGSGPVLAADPHLALSLPNALYEVDLAWPDHRLRGLVAPGLPVVLSGSNGYLVWGVTNLTADVLDLVPVGAGDGHDTDSELRTDVERIAVRGGGHRTVEVTRAGTMPLATHPLPDGKTAIRWIGHDPRSCDLRFQRIAQAADVAAAVAVLDDAHGFPLTVLLADDAGHTAQLATGLLPRRPADGSAAQGYLTGPERPRVTDPAAGVLVSANDAGLPEHPFRITHDPDPGYRARRIRQVLASGTGHGVEAARALQHDTHAALYRPYQRIAVDALTGRDDTTAALLAAWDGRADAGSRAFAVLVATRAVLAERVLAPYLAECRRLDPAFTYPFRCADRPLLAIVGSGDPALLPPGEEDGGWGAFVARCVATAQAELRTGRGELPVWGAVNRVGLDHPLSALVPWAWRLLGIAPRPQPGALHTVRTCVPGFGAVARAVLTPGRHGVVAFDLPAGQSGHPLSPHFDDRHETWSAGPAAVERPQRAGCAFALRPATPGKDDR